MESDSTAHVLRTYHESFSQPDADITLCSSNGIYFRLYSVTLRTASGFFRSTLSLPQKDEKLKLELDDVISLDEEDEILEKLFSIISGLGILPSDLATFEDVAYLLHTAEKYEMPGVIAYARASITAPRFLDNSLRLYAMSCRYGWVDEAKMASQLTLTLDICDPELLPTLETIDAKDLMRLLRLRWSRRELLKEALNNFSANREPFKCLRCNRAVDVHPWREWKWVILEEIGRRPSGDTVLLHSFSDSPKAHALFQLRCSTAGCERVCFDKDLTMENIRKCIETLPTTI